MMEQNGTGYGMEAILSASPLIPVITFDDPETAGPVADALVQGGARVLEITLRTPHGLEAIRRLRRRHPDILIGAGTVTGRSLFEAAQAAGAQFAVSPGSTPELLDFARSSAVPLLPGITTLSELMLGYQRGYRAFKFFPAELAGGCAMLRAFAGPFPDVGFCPTGGIRRETAADYLALAQVRAVGGTWLVRPEWFREGNWEAVTAEMRRSLKAVGGG